MPIKDEFGVEQLSEDSILRGIVRTKLCLSSVARVHKISAHRFFEDQTKLLTLVALFL